MSRVVSSGAEWSTLVTSDFWSAPDGKLNALTDWSIDTTIVRSGQNAFRLALTADRDTYRQWLQNNGASSTDFFFRAYIYVAAYPTDNTAIMWAGPADTLPSGTSTISVRMTSSGVLQVYNGNANPITGTVTVPLNTWCRLELYNQGSYPKVTARLNGVDFCPEFVLSNTPSNISAFLGSYASSGGSSPMDIRFDDIAINDINGPLNFSWPGAGKVVLLKPISDNARVGWTNGAGGTTNLFADVDNTPPVGVTTPAASPSQIKVTTNNTTDTYDANIATYDSAGVGPNDVINVMTLLANHGYNFAASATLGLQGMSNPVAAEVTGNSDGSAAGSYASHWSWLRNAIDQPGMIVVTRNPVLRIRHGTASNSRAQFVDAMGIYVDYTPTPGSSSYANFW